MLTSHTGGCRGLQRSCSASSATREKAVVMRADNTTCASAPGSFMALPTPIAMSSRTWRTRFCRQQPESLRLWEKLNILSTLCMCGAQRKERARAREREREREWGRQTQTTKTTTFSFPCFNKKLEKKSLCVPRTPPTVVLVFPSLRTHKRERPTEEGGKRTG